MIVNNFRLSRIEKAIIKQGDSLSDFKRMADAEIDQKIVELEKKLNIKPADRPKSKHLSRIIELFEKDINGPGLSAADITELKNLDPFCYNEYFKEAE